MHPAENGWVLSGVYESLRQSATNNCGISIAGQRSITAMRPAFWARMAAFLSITFNCIHTDFALIAMASSTMPPASSDLRKISRPFRFGAGPDQGDGCCGIKQVAQRDGVGIGEISHRSFFPSTENGKTDMIISVYCVRTMAIKR